MKRLSFVWGPILALLVGGCACTDSRQPKAGEKNNKGSTQNSQIALAGEEKDQREVTQAVVRVRPIEGEKVQGTVIFTKVPEGIAVIADIEGLTPGKHGFHVHEFGDCSGHQGLAAGGHFNPTNEKHGGPDSPVRHVGDLGNLVADENGVAHYERIDKQIAFEGQNSILGRSIVIHADPDDYETQPTGNSGARIACGVIEIMNGAK